MIYIIILVSLLFTLNNHPLTIGLLLILVSLFYALIVAYTRTASWLAYILILVFLRGLIIIILYITRLSSNENITINWPRIIRALLLSIIIPILLKLKIKIPTTTPYMYFDINSFIIIYKTYRKILREISLMLIIYLLVVLIVAIKIISLKKGPLKINQ